MDEPMGEAHDTVELIIPNLNWRYSGVTATNRAVAPLLARRCPAAWLGPHRPQGIGALSLGGLLMLRRRPPRRQALRIWHARRNVEMIVGLVLKRLGWRLGTQEHLPIEHAHAYRSGARLFVSRRSIILRDQLPRSVHDAEILPGQQRWRRLGGR